MYVLLKLPCSVLKSERTKVRKVVLLYLTKYIYFFIIFRKEVDINKHKYLLKIMNTCYYQFFSQTVIIWLRLRILWRFYNNAFQKYSWAISEFNKKWNAYLCFCTECPKDGKLLQSWDFLLFITSNNKILNFWDTTFSWEAVLQIRTLREMR